MAERDGEQFLGVFADQAKADAAAGRARQAGVDESGIRVGEQGDDLTSIKAEMQEETENSFLSPQAALIATKEMAKALALAVPLGALIGAALLVPFAFFFFTDFALWGRIVVAGLIGAVAGATVGAVAGGGLGAKGPASPLAAEHGVTVRVADARQEVGEALAEEGPLRLDKVDATDVRVDTVTTEEERTEDGVVEDLGRKWQQQEGDWSSAGHEDRQETDPK